MRNTVQNQLNIPNSILQAGIFAALKGAGMSPKIALLILLFL